MAETECMARLTDEQIAEGLKLRDAAFPGAFVYRRERSGEGREDRIVEAVHTCGDPESCYTSEDHHQDCLGGHVVLRQDATRYWANRRHDEANWNFIAWFLTHGDAALRDLSLLRQRVKNAGLGE